MIDPTAAEIGIAAVVQIGVVAAAYGGMRSDLKNVTGWLKETAATARAADLAAAELKGRVDTLPCESCRPGGD
jgi:hypothetical protein